MHNLSLIFNYKALMITFIILKKTYLRFSPDSPAPSSVTFVRSTLPLSRALPPTLPSLHHFCQKSYTALTSITFLQQKQMFLFVCFFVLQFQFVIRKEEVRAFLGRVKSYSATSQSWASMSVGD